MKLKITIDIFSGRENPVIELEGKEAEEALIRLEPAAGLKDSEIIPLQSILGYRGLIIEQEDATSKKLPRLFRLADGKLIGPDFAHRVSDEKFEDFIIKSVGQIRNIQIEKRFDRFLSEEISRYRQLESEFMLRKIKWPPLKKRCLCSPIYEPDWWNDGGQKQYNNNCYNYATNYRSDTFAQPGLAAGAMYTSLECTSVLPAAIKDELIDNPNANNRCPQNGHLVALVIAPGYDFHWYRKGNNGYWTHKPGGTPVTNLDNSGKLIKDPRIANRGPYTEFCTYMIVRHGHIKIK
ncbi:MAG TPA: hypothetical protein VIO11_09250 [Candidatus Methanoperedens sp.]